MRTFVDTADNFPELRHGSRAHLRLNLQEAFRAWLLHYGII